MKHWLLSLFAVMALAACKPGPPQGVISEGKMTNLLYDYQLARQMAETEGGDIARRRYVLVQKVFEKYGVTEAQFDSSMVWYNGHAIYLEQMYAQIDARLKREMMLLGLDAVVDEYANLSETGDTARIWTRSTLWLRNDVRGNMLTFNIPADSTYRRGDTFLLRFQNNFIAVDGRREAYALLVAHYDNDSVASQVSRVAGNTESVLRIMDSEQTDKHNLRRLSITFYLSYDPNPPTLLWMVSKPVLVRFHKDLPEESPIADSTLTAADSLALTPFNTKQTSATMDTISTIRLSPTELRQEHKGDQQIQVVKQRAVTLPQQSQRKPRR